MSPKELFKGTAWYYARYRRGYQESFFDHLVKTFELDEHSRALDLGTGTGQIALPLSKIVGEVVAVDPDGEMTEEGKAQAEQKDIMNITWINSSAEEISEVSGIFDITTMGASFHWMKQDDVLEKVFNMTKKGGGVAIVANISSFHRNLGNDKWKDVAIETVKKYLGEKRRAGKGHYQVPKDRFEDVLARSKFDVLETFKDQYPQTWSVEQIIGFLYSTSYSAKHLFGDQIDQFEDELRKNLMKLDGEGIFEETAHLEALLGKKY